MDIYRFFHPHHNPRLRSIKLRLQELTEISLAVKEIDRVLKRTKRRLLHNETSLNLIEDTINAINLAYELLETNIRNYPEDTPEDLEQMLKERLQAPGWEAWCKLVESRLAYITSERDLSLILEDNPSNHLDDSSLSVSTADYKKKINES